MKELIVIPILGTLKPDVYRGDERTVMHLFLAKILRLASFLETGDTKWLENQLTPVMASEWLWKE